MPCMCAQPPTLLIVEAEYHRTGDEYRYGPGVHICYNIESRQSYQMTVIYWTTRVVFFEETEYSMGLVTAR